MNKESTCMAVYITLIDGSGLTGWLDVLDDGTLEYFDQIGQQIENVLVLSWEPAKRKNG